MAAACQGNSSLYQVRNIMKVLPVVRPKENGWDISWHDPNSESSFAFFDSEELEFYQQPIPAAAEGTGTKSTLQSFLLKVGLNLLACSPKLCDDISML